MTGPFVITAPPALGIDTSGPFGDELRAATALHDAVTVNLEGVDFIDAYGLNALIGGHRTARIHDCDFTVICTRPDVLKLFKLTTMDRLLDVRPSLEACDG